ncbi:hypothetical protein S83_058625, partial [Arachis hypogaea]
SLDRFNDRFSSCNLGKNPFSFSPFPLCISLLFGPFSLTPKSKPNSPPATTLRPPVTTAHTTLDGRDRPATLSSIY